MRIFHKQQFSFFFAALYLPVWWLSGERRSRDHITGILLKFATTSRELRERFSASANWNDFPQYPGTDV